MPCAICGCENPDGDLHWLDSETQAFLSLLSESIVSARILLLVNYRPEYRHEWGNKTYYTQLRLDPLGQEDAQELLTTLPGNDTSLQLLKRIILEKTEGNPFFMEEIVQERLEERVLVRDLSVGAQRAAPGVERKGRLRCGISFMAQGVSAGSSAESYSAEVMKSYSSVEVSS